MYSVINLKDIGDRRTRSFLFKYLLWWLTIYIITYSVNSWVPEPRQAAKRDLCFGYLNTSPCMYFHPVSSWSSADSSSWAYLYHRHERVIIRAVAPWEGANWNDGQNRHFKKSTKSSYLTKSFLSTRIRMVARNPVRRRTVTHEFIIENQWISKWWGRDDDCEYLSILFSKGVFVSFHLTVYRNSTSTSLSSVRSTRALGSVLTFISITRSLL